ncbi:MAG: hypothetical protein ACR2P4_00990, partial [Gammaproteobacteria bacterium]
MANKGGEYNDAQNAQEVKAADLAANFAALALRRRSGRGKLSQHRQSGQNEKQAASGEQCHYKNFRVFHRFPLVSMSFAATRPPTTAIIHNPPPELPPFANNGRFPRYRARMTKGAAENAL